MSTHPSVPPQPPTPAAVMPRALAPDMARGFMLLLIAIANVSWHLWGHPTGLTSAHPTDGGPLDTALATLSIIFVDGRIYPMFAFLFGYGMVQFARSRTARGLPQESIGRMLVRRHLWLIVFGFVHALLLFNGDVLGAYGLTGIVIGALLFRRTDRTLKIVSWIFAGLLAVFALLTGAAAALMLLLPPEVKDEISAAMGDQGMTEMFSGQSNYLLAALTRGGMWLASTPGTLLMLTFPLAIVLGWLAARHGLLDAPAAHRRALGRIAVWGIVIGAAGALPDALLFVGAIPMPEMIAWAFSGLNALTGVAGGIGYAALFGLLAMRIGPEPGVIGRAVTGIGRRSLSFYLFQSVIFAPLLTAWGFGLGQHIGTTTAFAIAVGVWLLSLVLALMLDAQNRRGPAEVLLRRLTYGRDDPAR
ncbi:DUF418 domain-containing protein [Brevibacterium jeotgali]|uniref:Uncharacterized membrane protein YeiB n=1 Tax=Brevibacterium jeotgali TaxID=1262550 RepID=A0A2H1L7V4_9MICO|nr:DUF418 domain-containing protein [Brevibacterium jeotgali]TWC03300.1 putative membrane protein YeiB [Brevibacterium jeotgali]SMY12959.1 Uncharacterized membrane protein YeiB [Brevibacterium jeotgali]